MWSHRTWETAASQTGAARGKTRTRRPDDGRRPARSKASVYTAGVGISPNRNPKGPGGGQFAPAPAPDQRTGGSALRLGGEDDADAVSESDCELGWDPDAGVLFDLETREPVGGPPDGPVEQIISWAHDRMAGIPSYVRLADGDVRDVYEVATLSGEMCRVGLMTEPRVDDLVAR